MANPGSQQTMHDRVRAVLSGRQPDRHPFIDRLELWHRGLTRTDALPPEFAGMSLTEIHRAVGMGQEKFLAPYHVRLRGVEMVSSFNGAPLHHEMDPIVPRFPDVDHVAPPDQPGITGTRFITPVGTLTVEHTMLEQMIASGTRGYMSKHPITEDADYPVVEYILERVEFVPRYEQLRETQAAIGDIGYVIPMLERIPFQQLLIDYFDSMSFFYALHDMPNAIARLMTLLDQKVTDVLHHLADLEEPYVQFGDNLEGTMTNPKLFAAHALPFYQRYTAILHGQGKRVGSHTDGNLRSLLDLLPESGLDVCESVAAAPLVPYTFEAVWEAWQNGPLIWGGIPTPILESHTGEREFRAYIRRLLQTVGDRPIIFGVSDMVLPINDIDRVRWIAETIEGHALETV